MAGGDATAAPVMGDGGSSKHRVARLHGAHPLVVSFARNVTARPCCVYGVGLLVVFAMCGGLALAPNLGLSEQTSFDWTVSSDIRSVQLDAFNAARKLVDEPGSESDEAALSGNDASAASAVVPTRSEVNGRASLTLAYEALDGTNIFTPARVKEMCETENLFLAQPTYAHFCLLEAPAEADDGGATAAERNCTGQVRSVLQFFYPASSLAAGEAAGHGPTYRECTLLSASEVADSAEALLDLARSPATAQAMGFFIGAHALDDGVGFTTVTRSLLFAGLPLAGFDSPDDRSTEQRELVRDGFTRPLEESLLSHFAMEGDMLTSPYRDAAHTPETGLRVRFITGDFNSFEFSRIISGDLTWTLLAIAFVWTYISVHTGSVLVGSTGILQILLSLPVALFWYGTVMRIPYTGQIHIIATFIVLGVGADDIFVFADAWKQERRRRRAGTGVYARLGAADAEVEQVLVVFEHTRAAVFNTSFTTAVSFMSTALSPITPIAGFGAFAALAIVANYGFVVTLTPPLVFFWDKHLDQRRWRDCLRARKGMYATTGAAAAAATTAATTAQVVRGPGTAADGGEGALAIELTDASGAGKAGARDVAPPVPAIEPDVEADSSSANSASNGSRGDADSDTKHGEESPESMRRVERFFANYYAPALAYKYKGVKVVSAAIVAVYLVWVAVMTSFAVQMEPPREQEQWFPSDHLFTGLGDYLSDSFLSAEDDNYVDATVVWGISGIDRAGFTRWVPDQDRGTVVWDPSFDLSTHAAQGVVLDTCAQLRTTPCDAVGCSAPQGLLVLKPDAVRCWMDDFAADYLATEGLPADSALPDALPEGADFTAALLRFRDANTQWAEAIGFVGGRLRFVSIGLTTSLLNRQAHATTKGVYQAFEAFLDGIRAASPASMRSVFQTTGRQWAWLATEEALVSSLFQGLAICFPMALLVLVGSTRNAILATFATISVGTVIVSVLGTVRAVFGWDLGTAESIAGVLIIGLSVDAVVHESHMYHVAPATTRDARVRFAAVSMGITVVAGFATTFGAGAVMLICQLQFFTKMAVLMCSTLLFSLVASLGFFLALCSLVGPEGDLGDLGQIKQAMVRVCSGGGGGAGAADGAKGKREAGAGSGGAPPVAAIG